MKWLIYKHTLLTECEHKGWSYIGQTNKEDPNDRWQNGNGYTRENHGKVFCRAVKKYGWNAFSHEIIESDILTAELANEREKYWIAYYHTYIKDPYCVGYNMTPGGEQWGNCAFNWYTNGEIDICINSSNTEPIPDGFYPGRKPLTDEQKQKLVGKCTSDETKHKIAEALRNKVSVYNKELDIQRNVDKETAEKLVLEEGFIYGMRPYPRQKRPNAKRGWHTRSLTDEEKAHLREINLGKKHSDASKQKMSTARKNRIWITDGNIFKQISKKDALNFLNAGWWRAAPPVSDETRDKLSEALKGRTMTAEHKAKISESNKGKRTGIKPANSVKVQCVETGDIFNSIADAVKATGYGYESILKSIKSGQPVGHNRYDKNKVHFIAL